MAAAGRRVRRACMVHAGLVGDTASICCDVVADGGMCSCSTEHGAAARRCLWHAWRLLLRPKPACAHELSDGSDSLGHVLAGMWTVYHVLNVTAPRVYTSVSERENSFKYPFSLPESKADRLGRRDGHEDVRPRPYWFTRAPRALESAAVSIRDSRRCDDVVFACGGPRYCCVILPYPQSHRSTPVYSYSTDSHSSGEEL